MRRAPPSDLCIRRIDAATLRSKLRAPAVKVAPGAVEAAVTHVELVAERLVLVNRQLDRGQRALDGLVEQLRTALYSFMTTRGLRPSP